MSRGSFNQTYDVYYGVTSSSGPPGVLYLANQPCRVVVQNEIVQLEFPGSLSHFWVTYDGPSFNMADQARVVAQVYSLDYGSADVLAIPSGGIPTYTVIRGEKVTPLSGLPYYRVLIVPTAEIPVPPAPPPPPPPPLIPVACGDFSLPEVLHFEVGDGEQPCSRSVDATYDPGTGFWVSEPYFIPPVTDPFFDRLGCYFGVFRFIEGVGGVDTVPTIVSTDPVLITDTLAYGGSLCGVPLDVVITAP